jgi:hypothetical protein
MNRTKEQWAECRHMNASQLGVVVFEARQDIAELYRQKEELEAELIKSRNFWQEETSRVIAERLTW